MVKVKCKKCGKEYDLKKGDKPSDFQCECGGDLDYSMKTIAEFRKGRNPPIITDKNSKFCPSCGAKNPEDADFCCECGKTFNHDQKLVSYDEGRMKSIYVFEGMSFNQLATIVHEIFTKIGYKLKQGEIGSGVYLKESRLAPTKFNVRIYSDSVNMCLEFRKELEFGMVVLLPGVGGGLGAAQVVEEYNRIKKMFRAI